jgi:hypothetical protein
MFGPETIHAVRDIFGITIPEDSRAAYEATDERRVFFREQTAELLKARASAQEALDRANGNIRTARNTEALARAEGAQAAAEAAFQLADEKAAAATGCFLILYGRGSHEGYCIFMADAYEHAGLEPPENFRKWTGYNRRWAR